MTFEDLQNFETSYFYLNRQMLSMIGICAYQEPKPLFYRNCIVNIIFISGFLFETPQFFKKSVNLDSLMDFLHLAIPAFCSFVSYNVVIHKYQITIDIYGHIKLDIISINSEREKEMFRKYFSRNRINTWLICIMLYAYCGLLVFPSIYYATLLFSGTMNDTQVILPLPVANFVHTKIRYYEMLLYQCLLIFVIGTVTTCIYTSYMVLIQHACLLMGFVMLKINKPIVEDSYYKPFLDSDASNDGYNLIIDIAKSYMKATEFVKLLNKLSESVYLFQVAGAVFLIVLSFLYLSDMYFTEHTSITEMGKSAIYGITTIFVAYVNCYFGQTLINHSAEVLNELRQIPFYKFSIKAQKVIPLIVLRCTKPCPLMIGGMFASSHEFFSGMMQTSISYAMVFHAMR